MTISENVGLLKTIVRSPKVVPGLSRLQLFSIIRHYGIGRLYVGNRINYFLEPELFVEEVSERSGRTLFFHDRDDTYYYDVLDENTRCIRQKEGITIANHVCTDIENLSTCLKPKVKRIGGIK